MRIKVLRASVYCSSTTRRLKALLCILRISYRRWKATKFNLGGGGGGGGRVAESQAGVRPVTGRPERPGLPGRPARSDKLMLLNNLLKIHG